MKFFIVTHATKIPGQINYFEDYLISNGYKIFRLSHPLDNYNGKVSELSENGKSIIRLRRRSLWLLNYLIDLFLSVKYVSKYSFETYVGSDSFDVLPGIIIKKIFHKSYIILYFSSDYSEQRFHNKIMDSIYITMEKIVIRFADIVISNTRRAENKRKELGLSEAKSYVVINSVPLKNLIFRPKMIDRKSFIYVGSVTEEHGLLELIKSHKLLMKRLIVIGEGVQWDELKVLVNQLGIPTTLYRAKNHDFVIKYLQKFNGIGLAPYNDKAKWTYYCSPLKIFEYVATGVPVITSDRTELSQSIKNNKLGIVYKTNNYAMLSRQLQIFNTDKYYLKAKSFYNRHKIDILYKPILNKIVNNLPK